MEPRDKQETTPSIASGEIVNHAGGEFGRHGERFTRRSREKNRETGILETFSTTFFVFTADVELRLDVWRLRLEVRSFFHFSKAFRQVITGRN